MVVRVGGEGGKPHRVWSLRSGWRHGQYLDAFEDQLGAAEAPRDGHFFAHFVHEQQRDRYGGNVRKEGGAQDVA